MIVSNSRKLIYLRVPRTGSTSLSNFLVEQLAFDPDRDVHTPVPYRQIPGLNATAEMDVHATLDDILGYGILEQPLEDYAVYGVIRDPVDRFISAAWHICHLQRVQPSDNNDAVRWAARVAHPDSPVLRPQVDWLLHAGRPINRLFPYERLDHVAAGILDSAGALVTFHHRSESRRDRNVDLDEVLRQQILHLYPADRALHEQALGSGAPPETYV